MKKATLSLLTLLLLLIAILPAPSAYAWGEDNDISQLLTDLRIGAPASLTLEPYAFSPYTLRYNIVTSADWITFTPYFTDDSLLAYTPDLDIRNGEALRSGETSQRIYFDNGDYLYVDLVGAAGDMLAYYRFYMIKEAAQDDPNPGDLQEGSAGIPTQIPHAALADDEQPAQTQTTITNTQAPAPEIAPAYGPRLFDYAGLLPAADAQTLTNAIGTFRENTGVDFAVAIVNTPWDEDYQSAADTFYQDNALGLGLNRSGMLCIVNLHGNGYLFLSPYGDLSAVMVPGDLDYFLNTVSGYIQGGNTAGGMLWLMNTIATGLSAR